MTMSTVVHCLYCFEALAGSLERRKPLGLAQVEALWLEYTALRDAPAVDNDEQDLVNEDYSSHGESNQDLDETPVPQRSERSGKLASPQPRRITALSPSSGSSSSSTPVSASGTLSLRAGDSSVSASSSRSSFFSHSSTPGSKPPQSHNIDYPLFVTWNILDRHGSKSLRGCIGTFDPQSLETGLRSYALTSAFDDSRFAPIALRELSELECGVTLLTDFEPAPSPMEWEIGKHGLRISFVHHTRRLGATYLPDVAKEQGWTKLETLISLMRKAGWDGRREDWEKVKELSVTRYQGSLARVDYSEWRAWRDWVEGTGRLETN